MSLPPRGGNNLVDGRAALGAEHLDQLRLLRARARRARLGRGIGLGGGVLRVLRARRLVGARGRAVAALRLDADGGEARVRDVQEEGVAVLIVAPEAIERGVGLGPAVGRRLGDEPALQQRADHLGGGATAE